VNGLTDRLAARIRNEGPIRYSTFVDAALYDPDGGFYATHGSAGRRGDFITSVEVGPLFGAVVANALDECWDELGRPAPFRVAEWGAGRGTLGRTVVASEPDCAAALDYLLVERSARLRSEHPVGPPWTSADGWSATGPVHVVLANELLDNLAFDLAEWRDGRWREVRVDSTSDSFIEALVDLDDEVRSRLPATAVDGARLPVQSAAAGWLRDALAHVERGRVVVIDYADTSASLRSRPWREWVRTYRGHERGDHPLERPGSQDVTCEVDIDQLAAVRSPDRRRTQAEFLRAHRIEPLVEDGRRIWQERAHLSDLTALRARSRVREAEALLDPAGLGGFCVLEWDVGLHLGSAD
jgi:SAM-dependent MidA family methyltransferase